MSGCDEIANLQGMDLVHRLCRRLSCPAAAVHSPPHDIPPQAYSACEAGADHGAILGRIVQGLGLAGVPPRALQHPDARAALRSVLR